MPCYRFRFNDCFPLYYYGHVLPPPIIQIVLHYAREMTIWEDMCRLHDKLDDTLEFLRNFKHELREHMEPYAILHTRDPVSDQISAAAKKLCHEATVNLVTALNPKPRTKRRRSFYRVYAPATPPTMPNIEFVLPEMSNYV